MVVDYKVFIKFCWIYVAFLGFSSCSHSSEESSDFVVIKDDKENEEVDSSKFLGDYLDLALSEYRAAIGPIKNELQRETIYSIFLEGDTSSADVMFAASQYLFGSTIPEHGLIGMGYHDNLLVAIFDYTNSPFNSWYDKEGLNNVDVSNYEITEEEMDTKVPPYWKFKLKKGELLVVEKGDTLIFK